MCPEMAVMMRRSRKSLKLQGKMKSAVPLMLSCHLTSARTIGILAALWVLRGA
jgi:hypothetical protein